MSFCLAGSCSPTTTDQNFSMSSKDIMRLSAKFEKSTLVT